MHDLPRAVGTDEILERRGPRANLDPQRPYAYWMETECNAQRQPVPVATVFLTNRECPFRCLMCDLWQHTLTTRVPVGAIPNQIRFALSELEKDSHDWPPREIKLYNNGNFFDSQAIPLEDEPEIAKLVHGFETVIVENHPRLCTNRCIEFQQRITPAQLEIAIGLETSQPRVLESLNKGMTLEDYDRAVERLTGNQIRVRTFILHGTPFIPRHLHADVTTASVNYAFDRGVNCCSLIATRTGNGIMDELLKRGEYEPPTSDSIEKVHSAAIALNRGRVFFDVWDIDRFFSCDLCRGRRVGRIRRMNRSQSIEPVIECEKCQCAATC